MWSVVCIKYKTNQGVILVLMVALVVCKGLSSKDLLIQSLQTCSAAVRYESTALLTSLVQSNKQKDFSKRHQKQ